MACDKETGAALYETMCESCHYSLERSNRRGRSAARIESALKYQGIHGSVPRLSKDMINSIACVLHGDEFKADTAKVKIVKDKETISVCSQAAAPERTAKKRVKR